MQTISERPSTPARSPWPAPRTSRRLEVTLRGPARRRARPSAWRAALWAGAEAATIAQTAGTTSEQTVAYVVFAVIATVGVASPVVIYFALGDRAPAILERLKAWMAQNNAVIMTILCLIIGVKLIGQAIGGLSA